MSKYGDMVALLEWAMKTKANKPAKRPRRKTEDFGDFDLVELLRRKQKEAKLIEDFLKEQEKLNKKEDKKPDKIEFISAPRLAMLLVASFPITAPLYVFWLQNMLRAAGWK